MFGQEVDIVSSKQMAKSQALSGSTGSNKVNMHTLPLQEVSNFLSVTVFVFSVIARYMYNKYFVDIVFIIKNAVTIDSSICQTKDYDPSVPETYSS